MTVVVQSFCSDVIQFRPWCTDKKHVKVPHFNFSAQCSLAEKMLPSDFLDHTDKQIVHTAAIIDNY